MADGRNRLAHSILVNGGQPDLTRAELWEYAGVSKTQGGANLEALQQLKIVQPESHLCFGPALGLVLGISVGSESLRAALVDANGEVRIAGGAPSRVGRLKQHPDVVLDEIAEVAKGVLEEALTDDQLVIEPSSGEAKGKRAIPLVGVAVGWPPSVHRQTKMPAGRAMDVRWQESKEDLTELVAQRLGLPPERSYALSAAHAVALGAAFDDGRSPTEGLSRESSYVMLAVRLGGNISAGTVTVEPPQVAGAEGREITVSGFCRSSLIEGTSGFAGEIGHLAISNALMRRVNSEAQNELAPLSRKWPCGCGQKMHLEALASATALVRRIRSTSELGFSGQRWPADDEWEHGSIMHAVLPHFDHPLVEQALFASGRLVGHALASPILMLDPRTVVITGPLAHSEVKRGIEAELTTLGLVRPSDPVTIRLLEDEENTFAVPRGAALSVLRERVYKQLDDLVKKAPGSLRNHAVPITAESLPQIA